MIKSIEWEGNHIELAQFTVITGDNGSGKSRLLDDLFHQQPAVIGQTDDDYRTTPLDFAAFKKSVNNVLSDRPRLTEMEEYDPTIPALMSRGEIEVIEILESLYKNTSGVWIRDDIEQQLYPRTQDLLMAEIKRFVKEERTEMQVIVTAHSPWIIDAFALNEVVCLRQHPHGTYHARLLSECRNADQVLMQSMTTGELVSCLGHDWVDPTWAGRSGNQRIR